MGSIMYFSKNTAYRKVTVNPDILPIFEKTCGGSCLIHAPWATQKPDPI